MLLWSIEVSRLNWNHRQGPEDFDDTAPPAVNYQFDYTRNTIPGSSSWPEKHGTEKFGPSLVRKAWKSGLVVVAEIEGFPYPVAAMELRWAAAGVLEVKTLEGYAIPKRLWTRTTTKGLTSSGLLIEKDD